MSETRQRLKETMKNYMKEKNRIGLSAVRMILNAIQTKEKEKNREGELEEQEVVSVVSSYQKKLKESLEGLQKAERNTDDLLAEMEVVKQFLPEQLSTEEIEGIVRAKMEELSEDGIELKFGQVMKSVMAEAKGRADGRQVSEIVKNIVG